MEQNLTKYRSVLVCGSHACQTLGDAYDRLHLYCNVDYRDEQTTVVLILFNTVTSLSWNKQQRHNVP